MSGPLLKSFLSGKGSMYREIDENLITGDRLFCPDDPAPLFCNDCAGCSSCCENSAVMIILDAYDAKKLTEGLNYSFGAMLNLGMIQLQVIDGVVLPGLGTDENGVCVFLDENGRCKIHAYRPGICRMFPLARIYHEDGSFSYFVQDGECQNNTGGPVKIREWLGIDDIEAYEKEVRSYHDRLVELRSRCASAPDAQTVTELQTIFLKENFFEARARR